MTHPKYTCDNGNVNVHYSTVTYGTVQYCTAVQDTTSVIVCGNTVHNEIMNMHTVVRFENQVDN